MELLLRVQGLLRNPITIFFLKNNYLSTYRSSLVLFMLN